LFTTLTRCRWQEWFKREVTEPGPKVDCWISADPVAFLPVGYQCIGQCGQILWGKMMAGGSKPWLGFKFGSLLTGP
jgi:hypothetical protein